MAIGVIMISHEFEIFVFTSAHERQIYVQEVNQFLIQPQSSHGHHEKYFPLNGATFTIQGVIPRIRKKKYQ